MTFQSATLGQFCTGDNIVARNEYSRGEMRRDRGFQNCFNW